MSKEIKCETCMDTGYYGDNGPGIKGNREYQRCDLCHVTPKVLDPLDQCRADLVAEKAAHEKTKKDLSILARRVEDKERKFDTQSPSW